MRHAFWNALVQVSIAWLTIAFCWALFLWLVNGPWFFVGVALGVALPIPLLIVAIPFVLTWIADRTNRAVHEDKSMLD